MRSPPIRPFRRPLQVAHPLLAEGEDAASADHYKGGPMDLTTTYLGFELKNPIIASASPLSEDLDSIRSMEDAGVAAVVLFSLFEEQIRKEIREVFPYRRYRVDGYGELFDLPERDVETPYEYLEHISRAKDAVDIPIIASLNGVTTGTWIDYARGVEAAGANALELNIHYIAADPLQPGSVWSIAISISSPTSKRA